MKRSPFPNQPLSAFLLVFSIYITWFSFLSGADGATKVRRNFKTSTTSPPAASSEIFMISETNSRQEVLLDVGETVLIGCPLNRTNAYGCEWYKRSPQGGTKKRITQFFGRYQTITPCQLQIRSVTYDDAGTIVCKAMTDSSEPSFHTNQLTVTGQDDPFGNILQKPGSESSKNLLPYTEPEIKTELLSVDPYVVHTGANFRLRCEAIGNPKPFVSWRRGSKNYTELAEGSSFLELTNLTTDDSGVYKCEAINIFGRVVHEITLDVKGALQGASEIIDVTPRNVTLYEGSQGNITCIARFEGDPYFRWAKKVENRNTEKNATFSYQGEYYSVLNRTEIRPLGQHLYATTLLLQNVTVSGVYHCIVAGLQGYNHSEAYVIVEKDPSSQHMAQNGRHKAVVVLWIFSFVIFAALVVLCIVRMYGCPNVASNKILSSQASLPSYASSSRQTQLPKRSPETLSTDCTNPRHDVHVPLMTHGSCLLSSHDYKMCGSSCTYNSYDPESSFACSRGDSILMADIEAARSSYSHNAESCDSEFCSQQSVTSPRTQTSDYYTTRQLRINRNHRNTRSHPQHHHSHCYQHHYLCHGASEGHHHHHCQHPLHFYPQTQAVPSYGCNNEYCSCQNSSYAEDLNSSSNFSVTSDDESNCYSDHIQPSQKSHEDHHRHSYCAEDDGQRSRVAIDRRKLNPSPNLSFLRANPNVVIL